MHDMDWSEQIPNARGGLTIFAPSGAYSGTEIEALFDRLPQSK